MRTFVFGCRSFDEKKEIEACKNEFGIEIEFSGSAISMETVHMAEGADYVSVLLDIVTEGMLRELKTMGVKMVGTRTVGYDHIDIAAAGKLGIGVCNSAYSPDSVAEFTLMLMLMALRKTKRMMQRAEINDFSLKGLSGFNLSERTVGIVGTGCIGRRVAELLQGFGCRVYAYDPRPVDIPGVSYLTLEELFENCNLVSLHAPLRDGSRHMINAKSIESMPEGTVIINTSRGGLIDTGALIDAMRSGKISACGLDVIENEAGLYYYNRKSDILSNNALSVLRDMPNAVVTPHMAFYTDRSVHDMVRNSILAFVHDSRGEDNPFRIV